MLRRNFLIGLGAMLFAPAIVRAESIMPVRAIVIPHSALWMKIVGTDGREEFFAPETIKNEHWVTQFYLYDKIMNAEQVWLR